MMNEINRREKGGRGWGGRLGGKEKRGGEESRGRNGERRRESPGCAMI